MTVNFSRFLNDGLVGKGEATANDTVNRVERLPLTTGTWGFVFSGGNVYSSEGIQSYIHHKLPIADE